MPNCYLKATYKGCHAPCSVLHTDESGRVILYSEPVEARWAMQVMGERLLAEGHRDVVVTVERDVLEYVVAS